MNLRLIRKIREACRPEARDNLAKMRPNSIYSQHPGFWMVEASRRNLIERTGKTAEDWIEIVRRDGPGNEKEQREWLKTVHGFTTNYAMWIVEEAAGRGPDAYDPDAMVEAQFGGKKEALRPIYDELLKLGLTLGPDVKVCPCSTMVPFYRKHVFAQIKPTTNTRVDLGLCLRGLLAQGRLAETGGEAKGDRITHRIGISSVGEIDAEVTAWLKKAYEADS